MVEEQSQNVKLSDVAVSLRTEFAKVFGYTTLRRICADDLVENRGNVKSILEVPANLGTDN